MFKTTVPCDFPIKRLIWAGLSFSVKPLGDELELIADCDQLTFDAVCTRLSDDSENALKRGRRIVDALSRIYGDMCWDEAVQQCLTDLREVAEDRDIDFDLLVAQSRIESFLNM